MQVLSIVEEVDVESMGYKKEDLQRVHDKIDKLGEQLHNRPTTAPVSKWAIASPIIAGCALLLAGFVAYTNHSAGDLKNQISLEVGNQLKDPLKQLNDLNQTVSELKGEFEQFDKRALSSIRATIETAQRSGNVIPEAQLADYRAKVRQTPTSISDYWTTVAAIINYQTSINQMRHNAPNPNKVSRPCAGLTQGNGGYNYFGGPMTVSDCVVDLDLTHNALVGITFKDSVIRYHGGQVMLSNVTFVNCAFILDLPSKTAPAQPAFLLSLLDSSNQRVVKVSTPS